MERSEHGAYCGFEVSDRKAIFCITVHYPTESSATVPLKPLRKRGGGGIGTSQQPYINFKLHKFKGSSMTKKSDVLSENRKG